MTASVEGCVEGRNRFRLNVLDDLLSRSGLVVRGDSQSTEKALRGEISAVSGE